MTFMIREYLGYYLIDSPSLERFKDQLDKSKVKTVYNEQYGIKIWNNLWYQPR